MEATQTASRSPYTPDAHGFGGPKAPPKSMQNAAKAERSRRKACHGSWTECAKAHEAAA